MTSSGSYSFNPSLVDLVLDAFDRCEVRPSALTSDHMLSAKRSANQVLVRFSNRVPALWAVDEQIIVVTSGVQQYSILANTVAILTVIEREYQLAGAVDIAINLSTLISSTAVTIVWPAHGLVVGNYVAITFPISIGGITVQGFYQVATVPDANTITITAAVAATGTVNNGGLGPSYATTSGSSVVTMTLANHGVVAGGIWTVYIATAVGGLSLLGQYTVLTATTNTLTFDAVAKAGATATASEDAGKMNIAASPPGTLYTDRFMTPMSREDWATISSKTATSEFATSYWFNRLIAPQLNIWPLPLLSAPKEIHYWRMRQLQDANPQNTETADIPYRFEEAFAAALARALSIKWKPEKYQLLKQEEAEAWAEAAAEDRERAVLQITPQLQGYFR